MGVWSSWPNKAKWMRGKQAVREIKRYEQRGVREHSHAKERADGEVTPTSCIWLSSQETKPTERVWTKRKRGKDATDNRHRKAEKEKEIHDNEGKVRKQWQYERMEKMLDKQMRVMMWWWRCTWLSTSMAMSTNMSCSSFMLLSRRTMSLWRASISLSACLEIPESTICNTNSSLIRM